MAWGGAVWAWGGPTVSQNRLDAAIARCRRGRDGAGRTYGGCGVTERNASAMPADTPRGSAAGGRRYVPERPDGSRWDRGFASEGAALRTIVGGTNTERSPP